ncbi:DoxX family protein [Aquimarina sp. RZ0]|uniref:DoxX family protein n=1 Tax=Aquimarina sp. RZ0 TaxID=2607730 RepID=UPI0011F234DE|nr:DoxX family protein [Aquimarina sp. RZ0]KAA1243026.1 DoxX family protein [Aquimarina sp. RZ0]
MKIIYWISTVLIAIFILWSAYTYLFNKTTIDGVRELGFPDHFRVQLAILKIVAVVILLVPGIPIQIKEWGYAGIGLFLITAIVAHTAHKDPIIITVINLIILSILITSNIYLHKLLVLK